LGRRFDLDHLNRTVQAFEPPPGIWKSCPWQPRELIEVGLRQWLRCAGAALADDQVIGMPSRAVDEAWHGLVLCTATYADFCTRAYGRFLHHHPDGVGPPLGRAERTKQLERTVVAWLRVVQPGESCVLWGLDSRVGVVEPWGLPSEQVEAVEAHVQRRR
jgi:hypothetical protein